MPTLSQKRRGFTLVELLVVIAIIGVLVSLLLPAVQSARESGRRLQCSNQLRQIGLAYHNYYSAQTVFPFGSYDHDYDGAPYDPQGTYRIGGNWRTLLLPFMEMQALADEIIKIDPYERGGYSQSVPWVRAKQQALILPQLICPNEPTPHLRGGASEWSFTPKNDYGISTYMGNAGPVTPVPADGSWGGLYKACGQCTDGTVPDAYCPCTFGNNPPFTRGFMHGHNPDGPGMMDMYPNGLRDADVLDGMSNTLAFGEIHGLDATGNGCAKQGEDQLGWMSSWAVCTTVFGINMDNIGNTWQDGCVSYRSYHPNGANFVFVDGSTRFIVETVDLRTFGYLGARNDEQVISTSF